MLVRNINGDAFIVKCSKSSIRYTLLINIYSFTTKRSQEVLFNYNVSKQFELTLDTIKISVNLKTAMICISLLKADKINNNDDINNAIEIEVASAMAVVMSLAVFFADLVPPTYAVSAWFAKMRKRAGGGGGGGGSSSSGYVGSGSGCGGSWFGGWGGGEGGDGGGCGGCGGG